jgi:DNA mismatch repair protein MutL
MGKIVILPDIVCSQIAAGEVVERPAAVVKELVENSIDAGSSWILVSLLDGGRQEIRVVDNGCAMSAEDALMSIERHATSKIRSAQDLNSISSLGFRGEAVPSIAAVSRFELITREHEALFGTSIKVEGGILRDVREKGCPPGTQVLVRDLFYCVPARRKFLRRAETELAYITDQFVRISLSNPKIHMQLQSQEKPLFEYPACETLLSRAAQVLGGDISKSLFPINFEKDGITVSGFFAPPDIQRTNSQSLFLYVNGRAVRDRLLQRAVLTAYEALIARGKYPVALIFVGISPSQVDVNVHPSKREVRFKNPGEVISTVREALFGALSAIGPRSSGLSQWAPYGDATGFSRKASFADMAREEQAPFPLKDPPGQRTMPVPRFSPAGSGMSGAAPKAGESIFPDESDIAAPAGTDAGPGPAFSSLVIVGQLANLFILLEAPEGLVIIDQHAAHERILFSSLGDVKTRASQLLTRPAIVDLMPKEALLLNSQLPALRDFGFEIEPFGGSSFAIHAVPAPLSDFKPEEMLRDFLRYAEEECPANESETLLGLAKIASCHRSVRAGQRLRIEEIRRLLEALDSVYAPFTCPHGRPIAYTLTYEQMARFFKR